MSKDNVDTTHELDPELMDVVSRIAESQAPGHAVSQLIALASDPEETPAPFNTDGQVKEMEIEMNALSTYSRSKYFPLIKWAAIAATAAGIVLMLGMFRTTNDSSLFAQMQQALAKVQTIQCSNSLYRPGEEAAWKTSETMIEEPDRFRDVVTTVEMGTLINVVDLSTGRYAACSPANKRCMIGNISNLDQVRSMFDLFVGILRNADSDAATEIDRYQEDGLSLVEYEYLSTIGDGGPVLVNVKVNEETALPVAIKFYDSADNLVREIENIVFDDALEDELFSTEVPEGYDATEQDQ